MKQKNPAYGDRYKSTVERLNKYLYPSKQIAYWWMKLVSKINALAGVALVLYGYGFDLSTDELATVFFLVDISLGFFLLIYILRILYSFRRSDFLIRTWFEGILMLLITFNGLSHLLFDIRVLEEIISNAGIKQPYEVYRIGLMFFMLLLLLVEGVKLITRLASLQLKPATTFIGSFLLLILLGAMLLKMPALTVEQEKITWVDALFTSVSATCITGLSVVDTASYFTLKGQIVILLLIQIGGLGIVSFGTFFATFIRKGVGLKHQSLIQDFLSSENLSSSRGLLRQIIFITFTLEFIGAVLIFFTWNAEMYFESIWQKIYFSVFHSVSSFCNAGFSVLDQGMMHPVASISYMMQLSMSVLIVAGSIGFPVIQDVFSIPRLRERLAYPWKDWRLGSKIAVYTTFALIAFGTVSFFVLEYHQLLYEKTITEKLLISFFSIVNTRTSGFNTVDIAEIQTPTIILIVFLMFVGASPGSTGGGIKTTTFYIILVTAIGTIKGKKSIEISKRTISNDLIFKAFAIFTFAASYNIIAIFFLSITESDIAIERLVFEQFSAFATVGLSMGVTPNLSIAGKLILIVTMFLGRIGLLTLALSLSTKVISTAYKYPTEHVMVA